MARENKRPWTTLWDRQNRRVLLLAGRHSNDRRWCYFVKHDLTASVTGKYDVWRAEDGEVVFVEIHLDEEDYPLGFPDHLLSPDLLGSMTIWPYPGDFIWWHSATDRRRSWRFPRKPEGDKKPRTHRKGTTK